MGAAKRKLTLKNGLRELREDSQGIYTVEVAPQNEAVPLFMSAAAGNERSLARVSLINGAVEQMTKARKPMLCLLCDRTFGRGALPEAFVLVMGMRDDPSTTLLYREHRR
jgi:hypothetical protein